jgi:hypothetical protein
VVMGLVEIQVDSQLVQGDAYSAGGLTGDLIPVDVAIPEPSTVVVTGAALAMWLVARKKTMPDAIAQDHR